MTGFRSCILYCWLFILLFWVQPVHAQRSVQSYIEQYQPLALMLMEETGIPASIILSIAIVEGAACNSRNCRLLNNHFGVKAKKKHKIPGTNHITAYRYYESDTLSYRHFCEIISNRKYYQELKNNKDYRSWAHRISVSGYTLAPEIWKKHVLSTIRKYKLYELDEGGK